MPKLKSLSGQEVIKIFITFNFNKIAHRGSHVKLARFLEDDTKQTLTIPNHVENWIREHLKLSFGRHPNISLKIN